MLSYYLHSKKRSNPENKTLSMHFFYLKKGQIIYKFVKKSVEFFFCQNLYLLKSSFCESETEAVQKCPTTIPFSHLSNQERNLLYWGMEKIEFKRRS